MGKKSILASFLFILLFISVGCSDDSVQPESRLNDYVKLWNKQDFEEMYTDYLSASTKESYKNEDFIDRYEKVYSDLGITDLKVETAFEGEQDREDKEQVTLPIKAKMNSIAGEIEFDKDVELKKETRDEEENWYINWDTTFILPDLQKDEKIGIKSTKAQRGEIFDRNGKGLAINGTAQQVGIVPEQFDDTKKAEVAKILDNTTEYIDKQLNQSWVEPSLFVPIQKIAKDDKERIEQLNAIDGVQFSETAVREYPYKESAAHLTGYVGTITAEELEKHKDKGYSASSVIGKRGLEELLEEQLRGKDGYTIYIDREEPAVIAETEPEDGQSVTLMVDADLQKTAYTNMKGVAGTFSAVQPETGDVLALVSSPSFDPNDFILGMSAENYKKLEENAKQPLLNRFAATFSPGSSIKPLIAMIGLNAGTLDPNKTIDISGLKWSKGEEWGNASITRVTDPKRPVDLEAALQYSDNIYFAQTALAIGEDKLISGLKDLGVGEEKFPLEYPIRASQISNDGKLTSSKLLADTGYGQGEVLMSLVHLASLYGGIVQDGTLMKPRLFETTEAAVWKESITSSDNAALLKKDMRKVVTDGTATAAKSDQFALAGKTGTAELKKSQDEKGQENGLFVAYDQNNPNAVMSILVENVQDEGGGKAVQKMVLQTFEKWEAEGRN
ncbi:peptidoglycan glycosyltransferase [Bacillus sp. FJAT-27916]|uniref:penicillin-binding transpeptidase domain-containing protein n=1 Tax=Bacillus sp. FJAT-27916 TaxID=1679169 RepID=UPI0006A18821|nr:penicillin-binding transpeptidase domain-containing protein [Bacillus sp. FJAT-27916]KMY44789.1 peptidoglycan glycosyltransferase [Bacillus sp. FJAT-27916]